MADKLGIGTGVRELKIGQSILNSVQTNSSNSGSSRNGTSNSSQSGEQHGREESYHSIRYDFKPASSNTSSAGSIDVDEDNRVSVQIPHERGGQTNFSGHQKESNAKDYLLVIDHVTGEITLEKLSSQIMVKKTRSEKPDTKSYSRDNTSNLSASLPPQPSTSTMNQEGSSSPSIKSKTGSKGNNRVENDSSGTKATSTNDDLKSKPKISKIDDLSSDSSSNSSTDSDSDPPSSVEREPKQSTGTNFKSGPSVGLNIVPDGSSSKYSNRSPPTNSNMGSPRQKTGEFKQRKPVQSNLEISKSNSQLSDLNDGFDYSDNSDNKTVKPAKRHGQSSGSGIEIPKCQ